jgi:hypothetical protein
MSGVNNGLQKKIREVVPCVIYTHCYAHQLNLVKTEIAQIYTSFAEFFG